MSEEFGINRISLRIPSEMFEKLDRKRFEEKATFQQIGMRLFEEWLQGDRAERPQPSQPTRGLVACPPHLKLIVERIINDLSDPAEYEALRREGEAAAAKERGHRLKKVR